jgi:hypothetical protein
MEFASLKVRTIPFIQRRCSMDLSITNVAADAYALNRASTGNSILMKTLAKTEEGEHKRAVQEPKPPEGPKSSKQGRIDLYA